MNSNTSIADIMTKEVIVLDANDSLTEAERVFGNHNLRHAPVILRNELVGMLSLVDLRRSLEFDDDIATKRLAKVGQLMTPDPVHVQIGATLEDAAKLFMEDDFHAIPVLDGNRVVGIVSTTDVIRFLLESLKDLEEES